MQYYTYQLEDGTEDVGPYHCYNNYNFVAQYQNLQADYLIMLSRTMLSDKGCKPANIENALKVLKPNR